MFAIYVWRSSGQLPERVATHFGAQGLPIGWATQAEYVRFTLILGAVVPAFVVGLFALIQIGNGSLMNLPHKEYWLAAERREETFAFVRSRAVVLAALFIAFFAGIHYFTIVANTKAQVTLPSRFISLVGGCFLTAVIAWVASFVGHFTRKPL